MSNHAKILKTRKKIASNLPNTDRSNNKAKVISNIKVVNSYYTTTYSKYTPIIKKEKGHKND